MKVLFIDDEPLIRKGLQVIIPWAEYGFTEFYEAEDGPEGLEIIRTQNPELVLLDIHMETMSGLSVVKQARDNEFSGRIIILSGYSDFEYAKSAIDYGVTSYLLKPVDPNQLTEAVLKSIDELHKERLISIYSDQPAHMAKSSILTNILNGTMSYTSEMESIYHLNLKSNYYRLVHLSWENVANEDSAFCSFISSLEKNYLSVMISGTTLVLILTSYSQEQTLQKLLRSYAEAPLTILSSKADSHTALSRLYDEIKQLYQDIYFYKTKQSNLLSADALSRNSELQQDFNLITFTEQLLSQVLLLQNETIEQEMLSLSDYFIQCKPPRDSIGFILLNCYTQVTSKLYEQYPKLEFEIADKEKFTAHLYADHYLCDSIAYFHSQLQKAVAYIKSASQAGPCDRICQYIQANLSTPLKLETIAKEFGYNSAYLGKLFAKEVGCHFNTYVDQQRIELAKDYLEKGISIAQTCELSGFVNTDYFTKKFKKYVGILPSEYKKQHL